MTTDIFDHSGGVAIYQWDDLLPDPTSVSLDEKSRMLTPVESGVSGGVRKGRAVLGYIVSALLNEFDRHFDEPNPIERHHRVQNELNELSEYLSRSIGGTMDHVQDCIARSPGETSRRILEKANAHMNFGRQLDRFADSIARAIGTDRFVQFFEIVVPPSNNRAKEMFEGLAQLKHVGDVYLPVFFFGFDRSTLVDGNPYIDRIVSDIAPRSYQAEDVNL